MRKFSFFILLLTPLSALAQGGMVRDTVLQRVTLANPSITYAKPIAGAVVRVCTGGGTPCTPLASIYSDITLSTVLSNPTSSDVNGNFTFFALPGIYTVSITVNGIVTNFVYTINYTTGTNVTSTNIVATSITTATESLSGQLTSTLAAGTAPFVITSTTGVANLRVLRHPLVQFCGTTATCSATAQTSAQVVYGSVALNNASPSLATLTGISPAFTSTATYNCVATNNTTATNAVKITKVSASSFTITGPNTVVDVISYECVGT